MFSSWKLLSSSESTSNSHTIAASLSTATSSTTPILNQIQQQIQQHELLTQRIWFSIGVVLEVAVDEEAAVVWKLEADSLEISAKVEEVAVVGAEVGVGRVGAI